MHLSGTKLIVLFAEYKQVVRNDDLLCSKIQMMNYNESSTIIVYDISNIIRPKIIKQVMVDGSLLDTKLKDGYLYIVTDKNIELNIYGNESRKKYVARIKKNIIPKVDGIEISEDNIYIAENDEYLNYLIALSLNINNLDVVNPIAVLCNAGQEYIGINDIYFIANSVQKKTYGEYLCTVDFSNPEKIEIMSELKIDEYS